MAETLHIGEIVPALERRMRAARAQAAEVARADELPRQRELFQAETQWFPVLRALIQSGVMAKIGPFGIAAYISLKGSASLHNGQTAVSAATIAAQTGMSEKTAREALKRLQAQGLVTTCWQPGRNKVFQLVERLPITDARGERVGEAAWNFSSLHWKKQLEGIVDAAARELAKNVPGLEDQKSTTTINIGNVNVNVNVLLVAAKPENQP